MWTSLLVGLLLAAGAAAATGIEQGASSANTNDRNNAMRAWLRQNYPDLSPTQIDAIVAQYGDTKGGPWDVSHWGDQSDWTGLQAELDRINKANSVLGDMPEMPTEDDLSRLQQEAWAAVDAENQQLLDLYDQSFKNSESLLQDELRQNAAMFGDYRNQVLTNNAMNQQALAGATRFELDRQQRNAITRGASAAQRLVANINAQLGLQAQSAQQSLDTSNALAQNLLAHRQAQQGVRESYLNAQNAHNDRVASILQGQYERRQNAGNAAKQNAINDYNYAYDAWNTRANDYFQGDSLGRGIYSSSYGRRRNGQSNNSGI